MTIGNANRVRRPKGVDRARGFRASRPCDAQVSVGVANGPVTISDPLLAAPIATVCSTPGATSCAASAMAAYDVQQWAAALEALVPVYLATISCTTLATAPVTCTITIQWAENAVALDSKQSNLAGLQAPTYTLLVQP